jgi:hypothetical protein
MLISVRTQVVSVDGILSLPTAKSPLTIGLFPPTVLKTVRKSLFIRPVVVRLGCVTRMVMIRMMMISTLSRDTNFLTLMTQHGILTPTSKFIIVVNCTSHSSIFFAF